MRNEYEAMRTLHRLLRVRARLGRNSPGKTINGRELRKPITPRQILINTPKRDLSPIGTGSILENIEEDQYMGNMQTEKILKPINTSFLRMSGEIS